MPFPATVLGTQVQMQINGTWTSVVRYDANTRILDKYGVKIDRGAGGLQDKTPPSTCKWSWQDPNGVYNNENPRSPYYNVLPRNTPVRVYIPRASNSLNFVSKLGNTSDNGLRCSCPDTVATSIVGDIDVRVDIEPKRWTRWGKRNSTQASNGFMPLIAKYVTGQRSWNLSLREDGTPSFGWSSTGANGFSHTATVPVDMTQARLAIRATLDVDNGASQYTVTFYTASSITGSYTQLGAPVIGTVGVTSIFDSTSPIEIGTIGNGAAPATVLANGYNFVGRVYGARVYSGLTGTTLVANADFTAQATNATSFADGLGNTFTVGSSSFVEISNADYQFYGEFSAPVINPEKSKGGAGLVVTVNAEAGGIIRRLSANDTPLQSAAYRYCAGLFSANGWWTGEDSSAADTTQASSAVQGSDPATIQDITFNGLDANLPGSAGVMTLGSTNPQFVGVPAPASLTTETHFIGLFKFPSVPVAETVVFQINTASSTIVRWNFCVTATNYILRGYNSAGTEVATKSSTFGTGAEPNKWIAYHLQLTNSAGTIGILSEWMEISTGIAYTQNGIGTVSFAGSNGVVTSIVVTAVGAALSGVRMAHVLTSNKVGLIFWDNTTPTFANVFRGYRGETADARFIRICQLLGVTPVIWGALADSEQMGAEPLDTGLNIIYDCVVVSGGFLAEAPDQPNALEFYTLKSTYNQLGTLSLTWAQLADGLKATPDDTDVANDITLTRKNGGSARATLAFGPMSIQAPPNGINTVPDGPTFNNYQDSRLPQLVQQLLLVRTWPTSRYPLVTVNMEHPSFSGNANLFLLASKQRPPMRLTVTSMPTFLPPDNLELLVKGVTITLYAQRYRLEWACVPYGPYINGELTTTTGNPFMYKAAHTTVNGVVQQQLNAGITNSATSFAVKTLSGVLYDTTATNVPIKIDGELMLVGSISGATSPQTFNSVTRGINGYAAAHNANAYVYANPTLKARL